MPASPARQFHPTSVIVGVVLIAAAVVYQKWFSLGKGGWPWYFIVLVVTGPVPAVSLFPASCRLINWPALSLTMLFILLISMLWEAILALPYFWWNYQHWAMMGIFIGSWSELPIEAVLVWLAAMMAR